MKIGRAIFSLCVLPPLHAPGEGAGVWLERQLIKRGTLTRFDYAHRRLTLSLSTWRGDKREEPRSDALLSLRTT